MIGLNEFLLLNKDERANYLWEHGEFIINLKEHEQSFNLYSLNGYFVEVIYSNQTNKIIDIKPFRKGYTLDKYTDVIQVTELE